MNMYQVRLECIRVKQGVFHCFCFEMIIQFLYFKVCQASFSAHLNHLYHDVQETLDSWRPICRASRGLRPKKSILYI